MTVSQGVRVCEDTHTQMADGHTVHALSLLVKCKQGLLVCTDDDDSTDNEKEEWAEKEDDSVR